MTVKEFLESAEFIDADIVIYDENDIAIHQYESFSVNDPDCKLSPDVANRFIDFWLLDSEGRSIPELKIYL